jgi:hypothetical protein
MIGNASAMFGREGSRERAAQYRHRAEELRAIAHDWIDRDAQQALVRIANDYERMAEVVEGSSEAGFGTQGHA